MRVMCIITGGELWPYYPSVICGRVYTVVREVACTCANSAKGYTILEMPLAGPGKIVCSKCNRLYETINHGLYCTWRFIPWNPEELEKIALEGIADAQEA